jgi:hypothetical protein
MCQTQPSGYWCRAGIRPRCTSWNSCNIILSSPTPALEVNAEDILRKWEGWEEQLLWILPNDNNPPSPVLGRESKA